MKTPKEIMNDAMKGWHGDDGVHDTDGTHIIEALDAAGYVIVRRVVKEREPFVIEDDNAPNKESPPTG